jgi:hypothetical protein
MSMTTFFALPFVCSFAVGAMSFLNVRPVVMAAAMPFVCGGVWVLV